MVLLCSGLGGKEVSGPEPSDPGGSGRGLPGAPKSKCEMTQMSKSLPVKVQKIYSLKDLFLKQIGFTEPLENLFNLSQQQKQ